jgi:chemotaxis signal transduction protein
MSERPRLDWVQARERLARVQKALEQGTLASSEERERVYRLRADLLAQPALLENAFNTESIMVFGLAAGRYAIPTSEIAEVISNPKCAPVPGSSPELAGLIQVRGEVRPVWNLRRVLGITGGDNREFQIVLLRRGSREIGVQVDQIDEIRSVPPAARKPAPEGAFHAGWMTEDLVTVLDMGSLFEEQTEQSLRT